MLKMINANLLLVLMFFMTSCGDLFTKKEEDTTNFEQFATCKMDTEALALIMRENIIGELNCLEKNLNLFIEVVKSSRPGYLSHNELEKFIKINIKDIDDDAMAALGAVFDLSSLLFGDQLGYIKKSNVSKLSSLLQRFNRLMVNNHIYDYLTTEEKVSYAEHNKRKATIFNTLKKVGELFVAEIVNNDKSVNINKFLEHFENIENQEILSNTKSLLFIKKVVLGGDQNMLSASEIKRLATILGDVSKIAYDFINIPDVISDASEDEDIIGILKEDVETAISKFFYRSQPNEPILTFTELSHIVKVFFPENHKYMQYKESILLAKEVLFLNRTEVFSAGEFNILLEDLLYKNLSRGVLFYRAYRENKRLLDKDFSLLHGIENIITVGNDERKHKAEFNRIIKSYRFFKGNRDVPKFTFKYERNPRAIFEISVYEDIVKRVFAHFGKEDVSAVGDYILTQKQLAGIMGVFGELLEGENFIYPGKAVGTAETITLMTSLFHSQSNGDDRIEIPEFVEFIVTMLGSLNLSNELYDKMVKLCPVNSKGRYDTKCFRKNFRPILSMSIDEQPLTRAIPNISTYIKKLSEANYTKFMKRTATFSRVCTVYANGEEVPMSRGDGLVTWGGLLVIEQSMIRYDINRNGLLEPKELKALYKVFKPAIEAMIPVEFLKRYTEEFFKYIVMYQRVPEVPNITGLRSLWKALRQGAHFVKFLFKRDRNQDKAADRMTFAAVLEIIALNSPAKLEEPFDCEVLRE